MRQVRHIPQMNYLCRGIAGASPGHPRHFLAFGRVRPNFLERRKDEVQLRRIPLPRTSMNRGRNKGRSLLRRLRRPPPPEQIYPRTSTARTRLRTLHLPPTTPTIQPAPAKLETPRRLALSPSTQGRRSSAPSSASWWAAWWPCSIPLPSQKKLCRAFVPVGR